MTQLLWLLPVGLLLGAFGTLIGAGGGFLLVPLLLLVYPHETAGIVTSISLAVVFFNAASGSIAYARMRRINYPVAGWLFLATAPGAILGALTTNVAPRRLFDLIFGLLLLVLAAHLFSLRSTPEAAETQMGPTAANDAPPDAPESAHAPGPEGGITPDAAAPVEPLAATAAAETRNSPRGLRLAAAVSVAIGYVSTFLGIGGGIVHVPLLVRVMGFPVHVATATSHLILAAIALTGTSVHIFSGSFTHGWRRTLELGVGVVIGAQIGARLSRYVHGKWIIRSLAVALAFVGVRILMLACTGPQIAAG